MSLPNQAEPGSLPVPPKSRRASDVSDASSTSSDGEADPTWWTSIVNLFAPFFGSNTFDGVEQRLDGLLVRARQHAKSIQPELILDPSFKSVGHEIKTMYSKARESRRRLVEKTKMDWKKEMDVTKGEKITFVGGVLFLVVSILLLAGKPEWFHIWYSVMFSIFIPYRYFVYRPDGYHYFLADLCYVVNVLVLVSIWVFPQNEMFLSCVFGLTFGNNAVAIVLWVNKLVFHSVDKITSLYIHIMPCAVLYTLFHLIPQDLRESRFPAVAKYTSSESSVTVLSHLLWTSVIVLTWQVCYFFTISVWQKKKVNRTTSFSYLMAKSLGKPIKNVLKNWMKLEEKNYELGFMGLQFSLALSTSLLSVCCLNNRLWATVFLCSLFTWTTYQGGCEYIEVKRVKLVEIKEKNAQLEKELLAWQNYGLDAYTRATQGAQLDKPPVSIFAGTDSAPASPRLPPKDELSKDK